MLAFSFYPQSPAAHSSISGEASPGSGLPPWLIGFLEPCLALDTWKLSGDRGLSKCRLGWEKGTGERGELILCALSEERGEGKREGQREKKRKEREAHRKTDGERDKEEGERDGEAERGERERESMHGWGGSGVETQVLTPPHS